MRYRKLTATKDYSFGRGQLDFWRDVPDAPAQAVWTRLMLYTGEWFLDLREGMDWNVQVLGKYTEDTRDPAIQARVLGTQGVTQITEYYSNLNRDSRAFRGGMTIDTVYGRAKIVEPA